MANRNALIASVIARTDAERELYLVRIEARAALEGSRRIRRDRALVFLKAELNNVKIERDEARSELAEHKASMVDLLADAYAKGRRFNEDVHFVGQELS